MKKYGLIGLTLRHSWSKKWFEEMFLREGVVDAEYCLYEMPSLNGLRQWVTKNGINGFNVTIPYKEYVINYLDEVDSMAMAVGAVNCVSVCNGRLVGHNTDMLAFSDTLRPHLQSWHTKALILGTGGASKAVAYALEQMGITYKFVSRNPQKHPQSIGYGNVQKLAKDYYLIINATPVGMWPDVAHTPWPYRNSFGSKHLCYDLVYNPMDTCFLLDAARCGARTIGGLAMLYKQAQLSWNIWMEQDE